MKYKHINMRKSTKDNMEKLNYLALVIKEVGFFDNSILAGRIIFQKSIYLLKNMGLKLPYSFNLYVNGPYSPELASMGFLLAEKGLDNFKGDLTESDHKIIKKFKNSMINGNRINPIWFEAMGTTLCLKKKNSSLSKKEIFLKLKKRHDYLGNPKLYNKVWGRLKENKLI